jgi:hypothetical protein
MENRNKIVGFEALTAVVMKNIIFWCITACKLKSEVVPVLN